MLLAANDLNDLQSVIDVQPRVLVVFTQPSTCVPCRQLYPHLVRFAEKHINPTIVTVDLDKIPEAITEYDIMQVPTKYIYENGQLTGTMLAKTVPQMELELLPKE